MTRINEVAEKLENPEANTNKNRIDKQSSARIIKRSLWANAKRQGGGGKSQVSEMVNATLETGRNNSSTTESTSTKRAQDDEDSDEDDDEEEEGEKEESNRSRTEKRLKV